MRRDPRRTTPRTLRYVRGTPGCTLALAHIPDLPPHSGMHADTSLLDGAQPFLTATWRDLVIITWATEPSLLRSMLPAGTELDLWDGDALASVVAFDFANTRVRGIRVPFHTRFPEVNLRFYVRRKDAQGQWRRGVCFVQEMVPRAAIAITARMVFQEPYVTRAMRAVAVPAVAPAIWSVDSKRSLVYEWKRDDEWERVIAMVTAPPREMRRGSLEEFILEHYWGYTRRKDGRTAEYQVAHPRWRICPDATCMLEADSSSLFGRRFESMLDSNPISTFVAEGSNVAVSHGRLL